MWAKSKKPIVLECFTDRKEVFEFAKPDFANKFLPDWWKNIPTSMPHPDGFTRTATAKKCVGIIDYYKHGVMLPLWSDLAVEIGPVGTEQYRWQFSDARSHAEMHSFSQFNNYLDPKNIQHLKLISPWGFYCEEDVYWDFADAAWARVATNELKIVPGCVQFKYQPATNINIFFYRTAERQVINFNFGEPLVRITPISERPLKLKYSFVTSEEFNNRSAIGCPIKFFGKYSEIKRLLAGKK